MLTLTRKPKAACSSSTTATPTSSNTSSSTTPFSPLPPSSMLERKELIKHLERSVLTATLPPSLEGGCSMTLKSTTCSRRRCLWWSVLSSTPGVKSVVRSLLVVSSLLTFQVPRWSLLSPPHPLDVEPSPSIKRRCLTMTSCTTSSLPQRLSSTLEASVRQVRVKRCSDHPPAPSMATKSPSRTNSRSNSTSVVSTSPSSLRNTLTVSSVANSSASSLAMLSSRISLIP
mmetsp:Transcript_24866/g.41753  ORF Transcript_24866/g.41753 Transcript_24866/m.41753 type:complete len:229 (-) Transcript_24866:242-928(-)